jgi:hypothetical protein
MTLQEFYTLQEAEKRAELYENGLVLGHKFQEDMRITLYRLHSFYVEAYYDRKTDDIKKTRTLSDSEISESYINEFNSGWKS